MKHEKSKEGDCAVLVASFDGINSRETGVGTIAHCFFDAYPEIVDRAQLTEDFNVALYAITPHLKSTAPGFDRGVYERCAQRCSDSNGGMLSMQTLSDGEDFQHSWDGGDTSRTLEHWALCSKEVALAAEKLAERYALVVIFLHDVPYVAVRQYIDHRIDNIYTIYIPHSLSATFNDRFARERGLFEAKGFAHFRPQFDYIGYVSGPVKRLLTRQYEFDDSVLLPFLNGVHFRSDSSFADIKRKDSPIPENKKIIFSWGRLSAQKGYDLLIPAVAKFLSEPAGDDYCFMMVAPHKSGGGAYFSEIAKQLADIPEHQRLVSYEYSRTLPVDVLRHSNARIVVLPSRFESFGLTAVEAGLLANPKAQIVYSPIESFSEFFHGLAGCHAMDDLSSDSIYRALVSIAATENLPDRGAMADGHDFVENYVKGLDAFTSRVEVTA